MKIKHCKFCGKEITGRSNYCNVREKNLYNYYSKKKGVSDSEIIEQSDIILRLADIREKPYKRERMRSINLPINDEIRFLLESKLDTKVSKFLRNEITLYLCLSETNKRFSKKINLDKYYSLALPEVVRNFLNEVSERNMRAITNELSLFMFMLYDKLKNMDEK